MSGLEPRGFTWVIAGRLAVSERIGGHGFQHRRVRREEELIWLKEHGVNTVVSLLPGNQNHQAYENASIRVVHEAIDDVVTEEDAPRVFRAIEDAMAPPGACVLVHRDLIGDAVAGLLGGYLVHAKLIEDPIVATSVIQEITKRPLGPEGRRLIPEAG